MKQLNNIKKNYNMILTLLFATGQYPVQDCMFSNVLWMDGPKLQPWIWMRNESKHVQKQIS